MSPKSTELPVLLTHASYVDLVTILFVRLYRTQFRGAAPVSVHPASKMPFPTIVFTDVVGSALTKRDESLGRDNRERDRAYLEKIQTPHFNMVRECCLAHGGKEVSTIGDAFYLTFEDPVEGVRCAVEIQKGPASAPILTPLGPLQLRIGVHSGYPEPYEGGWHGADVDTAARVESAASACQILLSARTYELVRHMTDVKFRSRGEFALKGMDRITQVIHHDSGW